MESSTGQSETRIIASTNVFQIEKIEKIGKADYPKLIEISLHLAKRDYWIHYWNPFRRTYQGDLGIE